MRSSGPARVAAALGLTCVISASILAQSSGTQVPSRPPAVELSQVSPKIVELVAEADRLRLALRFDEAQACAEEAIALAERLTDRPGLAGAHRMKATVLNTMGRSRDAMSWGERALAEYEAIGDRRGIASALSSLTVAALTVGDSARAGELGERALRLYGEIGDDRGRATLLVNLAALDKSSPLLEARFTEILDIAARLGDEGLKGDAFKLRGNRQFGAGDLSGAQASYEAAAASFEKTADLQTLAATYLNLGRVLRAHGDYEGALRRYQRAIEILAPTKERFTLVEAVNASAVALGFLDRHAESIAAYERGLALARESGNDRLINFMLGNLAGGLTAGREYARAIPMFEEVLAKKPEPYIAAYYLDNLADAYAHVDRSADAVPLMDEAIRITRELKQVDALDSRLDDRAWILTTLGRLDEALADSREAIGVVEQIRARLLPSDFLKRGYGERVRKGYARAVDLLSRLGRGAEALDVAEQGRARAFLDLLAARESTNAVAAARDDGASAAPHTAASLTSEAAARPVSGAAMGAIAKRLNSTILTYWVGEDATIIWVIGPGGVTKDVRVPVGREKMAALVAATTAPLREAARATTTRGAADVTAAPPQASADDLAALPMRGLGLLALTRDDKAAWRQLYKTLIAPIRASLPASNGRLTIVPDGSLFHLSFAALQSPAGRYLIEDFDLHYAPAVSTLEFTGRRQQAVAVNAKGPWAIVGNPTSLPMMGDRPLAPLPGAAREISSIAALAPATRTVIRLDGDRADKAGLVRTLAAAHPSVLHFATHGFVFDDPKKPPFLALNRRGDAPADDGRLTLDDVYGLSLSTDLVVLSACRTGSGQVGSDGIVGLTRGFFYAGSPSVMATFWDVTDEATAVLMSTFYRSYARAHGKSASLRAAQLTLLADLRAGRVVVTASGRRVTLPEHPLLWAAFFLSGEP